MISNRELFASMTLESLDDGNAKAKDADSLAGQLAVLLDGAIIQMLVRNDAGMADVARKAAATLLTAAGVKLASVPARRRAKA